MHWKGGPKSHYISWLLAVAAESHYSSLTVSKRAAGLGCASRSLSPCNTHRKLPHTSGGETAATPMHVSLSGLRSWVGVDFGVIY